MELINYDYDFDYNKLVGWGCDRCAPPRWLKSSKLPPSMMEPSKHYPAHTEALAEVMDVCWECANPSQKMHLQKNQQQACIINCIINFYNLEQFKP